VHRQPEGQDDPDSLPKQIGGRRRICGGRDHSRETKEQRMQSIRHLREESGTHCVLILLGDEGFYLPYNRESEYIAKATE
jgi:hypothetical protein